MTSYNKIHNSFQVDKHSEPEHCPQNNVWGKWQVWYPRFFCIPNCFSRYPMFTIVLYFTSHCQLLFALGFYIYIVILKKLLSAQNVTDPCIKIRPILYFKCKLNAFLKTGFCKKKKIGIYRSRFYVILDLRPSLSLLWA